MDRNDRVLVTGATGFIGGRLVELLAAGGVRMRISTSDFRHCSRVARFPVELVKADLLDHEALGRAVAGCDVVFHLAYRWSGNAEEQEKANVAGTRALAEAFLKNGGRRFVHISSISAYGAPRDGDLTEDSSPRPTRNPYANIKLKIEHVLRSLYHSKRLPVTIIQPTIVYGPYGSTWTIRMLDQVRSSQIVLPARGLGLCNAVYVDDVVTAMMSAVECDAAIGETFLISGSAPITWHEFYGAYENMLGKSAILALDDAQVRIEERRQRRNDSLFQQLRRALTRRPALRKRLLDLPPQGWLLAGGRRLLPDPAQAALEAWYDSLWLPLSDTSAPLYLHDLETRALYSARTNVRINKARKTLGYKPAFDLHRGMALTREWAR